MTPRVVNVHSVPPRGDVSRFKAEHEPRTAERFSDHVGVILVAAAERGVVPERWGLGLALVVLDRIVIAAQLVVCDDLAERNPGACQALGRWAATQAIRTPQGDVQLQVVTRRQLCHPADGLLIRRTYRGGGWLATADEGRSLGLLAEWWGPARGWFRDGYLLGLPGCGEYATWADAKGRKHSAWRPLLHTPPLRVKALGDHGLMAEYARAGRSGKTRNGEPAGRWEDGKPFRGRIVDFLGPAFALDGQDTSSLAAHLAAFGLPAVDVPTAEPASPEGAEHLLAVARAIHQLALALDGEAARWLVSGDDLRDGRATVGLRELVSGGSLAKRLWQRSGATPPLAKHAVPDDEALDQYGAGSHGGWNTAELRRQVLPGDDVDGRQAYPAAACLAGIHHFLFAEQLHEVDQLDEVRGLSAAAAVGYWKPFLDRATYERYALTRCVVLPHGEPWPVELHEFRKPAEGCSPRFYVRPVKSAEPIAATFGDVIVASCLSGRPVTVLSAIGLEPFGTDELRPIPLRDGVIVPAGEDPLAPLVRLRPPKGTDDRLRACIRGISNPAAWGSFARLDQRWEKGKLIEEYAAWSWPPIASCIPAIVRMWLAMIDRAVSDAGGAMICRDTDGLAVVSSPEGGKVELADGRIVRALSWAEVDGILRPFNALDPFGDVGTFWTVERKDPSGLPLYILSLGRKRYSKLVSDGAGGFEVVGGTEHSLGGGVVDPPGWGERATDGLRRWVRTVHRYALACAMGPDPGWRALWDEGTAQPFPIMRRYSASTPRALAEVPKVLGLHPFGPWIEAQPDKLINDRLAVALDPGDDLADWAQLRWFDRHGHPIRVGTIPGAGIAVVLRTLDDYAYQWTRPAPDDDDDLVEIDPRLIRRVGRGGALIDAQLVDPEARAEDHQVVYSAGDPAAFVAAHARRLGPRPFARLTGLPLKVAERVALGQPISDANVAQALHSLTEGRVAEGQCELVGCEQPVPRPNARYCSRAHADRAYRERRRRRSTSQALDPYAGVPRCGACGSLMLGDADTGTGVCSDCAEAS